MWSCSELWSLFEQNMAVEFCPQKLGTIPSLNLSNCGCFLHQQWVLNQAIDYKKDNTNHDFSPSPMHYPQTNKWGLSQSLNLARRTGVEQSLPPTTGDCSSLSPTTLQTLYQNFLKNILKIGQGQEANNASCTYIETNFLEDSLGECTGTSGCQGVLLVGFLADGKITSCF